MLFIKVNSIKHVFNMAYGETKDLVKRTQSEKVLKDKPFKNASDPKYDRHQRGLTPMV